MPLVYQRQSTSRPEDAALIRMRNEVAARHRFNRLAYKSKTASQIEYKQKAAYERTTKKPFLPEPKPEPGYSSPEWDVARGCWLAYLQADHSKWTAWDAVGEKWVNIATYDQVNGSSSEEPSSQSSNNTSSPELSQRTNTGLTDRPKRTLRSLAKTVINLLQLRPAERQSEQPASSTTE